MFKNREVKKILFLNLIYFFIIIIIGLVLSLYNFNLYKKNLIKNNSILVGNILKNHPELEEEVINELILNSDTYDYGTEILNKYGLDDPKYLDYLKLNITKIVLIIFLILLLLIIAYNKIKAFRRFVQELAMKIPLFGKIIVYKEMNIFAKTFASLLKNNVFITESISLLSEVTNNEIYKEIMLKTINNIAKGEKISESFYNQWAVPEVAYYMIVTGESTGELAEMMDKVATDRKSVV